MARQVVVTYQVKAERVEEHESLIRAVFAELAAKAPPGFRYGAYKKKDGVSFVHFALMLGKENPLDSLAAFNAFTEKIKERCATPPEVQDLTVIGAFEL